MKKFLSVLFMCIVSCAGYVSSVNKPVYDETSLKEFVLSTSSAKAATRQLDSILHSASEDSTVFLQTVTYLETPFGSPNSAYRNDSLYSILLQSKAQSKWIDTIVKQKAKERIQLLRQNQPGNVANDFFYQTLSGYVKNLHDLKANFTLLFFYNPECPACKEMKTALTSSTTISEKIKSKELIVLAVYTDKDESIWLNHLSELPQNWIHGRDKDDFLHSNGVYDLRAIPTLYLLDANKIVLLKDCMDVGTIEERIR